MFRNILMSGSDALVLFDAGMGQAQGGRPAQEDRCTYILPSDFAERTSARTEDGLALFAVYDGHGSDVVAEHASQNLHKLLTKRPEFDKGDYEAALKGALEDEDTLLLDMFRREDIEPAISGSTVALCFLNVSTGDLVVANLGDSHAILAERDPKTEDTHHVKRLTVSHKPDNPSERKRIEGAGGEVNRRTGTARVGSINMSRAIGDLQYKNPINTIDDTDSSSSSSSSSSSPSSRPGSTSSGKLRRASSSSSAPETRGNFLSNEPYMTRFKLSRHKRYLLALVSDGISDHMEDTVIMQYVSRMAAKGFRTTRIAQEVAKSTTGRKGADNGSCVVALIDGQDS